MMGMTDKGTVLYCTVYDDEQRMENDYMLMKNSWETTTCD